MNSKSRILFISTPVGAGHTRAAQAVQQAVQRINPSSETQLVNMFDFFPPIIGRTILRGYLLILRLYPSLYGSMYDWGNNSVAALAGRDMINRYLADRMLQFIKQYNPDAIVCTHATPAGLTACLRRNGQISMPVFAVITDFVLHRLWVYADVDHYYVSHSLLQEQLQQLGISQAKSLAAGIPVSAEYACLRRNEELLQQFQFTSNLPVILIMGGGGGLLPMDDIIGSICRHFSDDVQIIAVTGHNDKLYHRLQARHKHKKNVCILGFVNYIPALMALAAVIISKPGGMTSAEALCAGLPLIIYRPIPGQEEGNAQYLTSLGVAKQVNDVTDLPQALGQLLNNKAESYHEHRNAISRFSRPAAAHEIANHLINFLQTGQVRT